MLGNFSFQKMAMVRDLDLGTVLGPRGTWAGATMSLSRTGALTCPASLTCSGATQTAIYNVSGSNQMSVRVSAPDVRLDFTPGSLPLIISVALRLLKPTLNR